jgi:hypothetical protein
MVQKKGMRVGRNVSYLSRDYAINKILINSHTSWGVTISQILNYTPTDLVFSLLIAKFGFGNKMLVALIIAFIL